MNADAAETMETQETKGGKKKGSVLKV